MLQGTECAILTYGASLCVDRNTRRRKHLAGHKRVRDETRKLKLAELFRNVVGQMADDLGAFARSLESGPLDTKELDRAYGIAHSLHGAGALYGYPCLSELGAAMEKLVNSLRTSDARASRKAAALFESCSAALRDITNATTAHGPVTDRISDLAWQCECALRESGATHEPTDRTSTSPMI